MWIVILFVFLAPTLAFGQFKQINCAVLDPRISTTKDTEAKVKASVTTVLKVAQAGGEVERRAKEEIKNLPTSVTGQEQLQARWIYLFCEMLRTSDLSPMQKDDSFKAVMRAS